MATATTSTAARGTLLLVASRGGYFILGYLAVVLLARGLGPAAYGAYGVIMSILVWLEQAGRFAIPSAATKLLAETSDRPDEVAKSAIVLNLSLYIIFFVCLWLAAPWLASWFGLPKGTGLFRLAAIDFPLFGLYTGLQSIHQGHRRFMRLGIAEVLYAAAKCICVALMMTVGISIEIALLINIVASVVGALTLCTRTGLWSPAPWRTYLTPLIAMAVPLGLYSLALILLSSLDLWVLQIMMPASEAAAVGVFAAALNIARVPGFTLSAVAAVLLPSVSRAAALGDVPLIKRYLHQALVFFLLLYLPMALVLMAPSELLMQWVYSNQYAGGGLVLSILLVAHGLWAIHAILGSVLIATGHVRASAMMIGFCILPAVPLFAILVGCYGSVGAALANVCLPLLGILLFARRLRHQFGTLLKTRSLLHFGLAAVLMMLVYLLLPQQTLGLIPVLAIALVTYGGTLLFVGEIQPGDITALLPWQNARSS